MIKRILTHIVSNLEQINRKSVKNKSQIFILLIFIILFNVRDFDFSYYTKANEIINKSTKSFEKTLKNIDLKFKLISIQDRFYNPHKFLIKPSILTKIRDLNYKDPLNLKISKEGKEFIKKHESLSLTAYKLGEKGVITIGYGHAECDSISKFKEGQKISMWKANQLFENDIINKEADLKRLFSYWKNQGIDLQITQNMWDSMVSLCFNCGIGGIIDTQEFIDLLKAKKFVKAGEYLKTIKLTDKNIKNFPGLIDRRNHEYELYMKELEDPFKI